jgi:hypothetical protein
MSQKSVQQILQQSNDKSIQQSFSNPMTKQSKNFASIQWQKHTTILQQIFAAQSDEKTILKIILQQILEQSNDQIK